MVVEVFGVWHKTEQANTLGEVCRGLQSLCSTLCLCLEQVTASLVRSMLWEEKQSTDRTAAMQSKPLTPPKTLPIARPWVLPCQSLFCYRFSVIESVRKQRTTPPGKKAEKQRASDGV